MKLQVVLLVLIFGTPSLLAQFKTYSYDFYKQNSEIEKMEFFDFDRVGDGLVVLSAQDRSENDGFYITMFDENLIEQWSSFIKGGKSYEWKGGVFTKSENGKEIYVYLYEEHRLNDPSDPKYVEYTATISVIDGNISAQTKNSSEQELLNTVPSNNRKYAMCAKGPTDEKPITFELYSNKLIKEIPFADDEAEEGELISNFLNFATMDDGTVVVAGSSDPYNTEDGDGNYYVFSYPLKGLFFKKDINDPSISGSIHHAGMINHGSNLSIAMVYDGGLGYKVKLSDLLIFDYEPTTGEYESFERIGLAKEKLDEFFTNAQFDEVKAGKKGRLMLESGTQSPSGYKAFSFSRRLRQDGTGGVYPYEAHDVVVLLYDKNGERLKRASIARNHLFNFSYPMNAFNIEGSKLKMLFGEARGKNRKLKLIEYDLESNRKDSNTGYVDLEKGYGMPWSKTIWMGGSVFFLEQTPIKFSYNFRHKLNKIDLK